jgi:hypothetical protein
MEILEDINLHCMSDEHNGCNPLELQVFEMESLQDMKNLYQEIGSEMP